MPTTRNGKTNRSGASNRRVMQQLRALAHPLRLRLLEAFAEGPRTTMQVATRLGQPPTRLYHHVNALERAGILKLVETRPVRGTTEKYYGVARKRIGTIKDGNLTASSRTSIGHVATVVFDQARRELMAAIAGPGSLDPATAPMAMRMILTIPPSKVRAVRRRLLSALKKIQSDSSRDRKQGKAGGRQWALTFGLSPTVTRVREP